MSCCAGKIIHGATGIARSMLGIGLAEPVVIEARRDACRLCPHSTKRECDGQILVRWCELCGCLIAHKSRLASEQCPDNRWKT